MDGLEFDTVHISPACYSVTAWVPNKGKFMKNYAFCFVYLIAFFLAVPALYAKNGSDVITSDLLFLVTPQTAPGYVAVIFIDENTVAVLGNTAGLYDNLFPCSLETSAQCLFANSQFSSLSMYCDIKDWCSEIKRINYKVGHVRCQDDRRRECMEIGIRLDLGGYFWLVPIQMSYEEFNKKWANSFPGKPPIPASAVEWKSAVDNLNAKKRMEEQEQIARLKAEEQAQLAREKAAIYAMSECLRRLKIGDPASKAYFCGSPDHTNSDLHTDQLVYSEGTMVYIDKATDTVEDVQWTH
jgi:hypothetical protein